MRDNMRVICATGLLSAVVSVFAFAGDAGIQTIRSLSNLPLAFTKNNGQWDDRALYRVVDRQANLWFTSNEICYQFSRPKANETLDCEKSRSFDSKMTPSQREYEYLTFTTSFVDANPNPQLVAEEALDYKCNYFLGNDSTKWRTDVPNFNSIMRKDIYPGIDVRYYGNESGQLEHDFIVAPGADYSQIRIRFNDVEELSVSEDGALLISTAWGEIKEMLPQVYQESGDSKYALTGEFQLVDEFTVRFLVEDRYDRTMAVVIDPVLIYSTFLGGTVSDLSYGIAVDAGGNAYVTGETNSSSFPTASPIWVYQGGADVFITKLHQTGGSLVYSTFVGGSANEGAWDIALNSSGSAFVAGYTSSTGFPQVPPGGVFNGGSSDGFILKINASGNALTYSRYLGGSLDDACKAVAVDASDAAYVAGWTLSTNFPLMNACQSDQPLQDAFVTKLNSAGTTLLYSTYLGGNGSDGGNACEIAVDAAGSAYVVGSTESTNFPAVNAFQPTFQGTVDGFITKLGPAGCPITYSTYLGGGNLDWVTGIAVDNIGSAYLTGRTHSNNFPAAGGFDASCNNCGVVSGDAFVTRLGVAGNAIIYSSFLGGNSNDEGKSIVILSGQAYLTGHTSSADFPAVLSGETYHGAGDGFVARVNSSGQILKHSSFLGGSAGDVPDAIAVDAKGFAYATGVTNSTNFPIRHGFDETYNGGASGDGFVSKLGLFLCGDANDDGVANISDAVFIVQYIFGGGPAAVPPAAADADCSGTITISDAVWLIQYIFAGGSAPCSSCP